MILMAVTRSPVGVIIFSWTAGVMYSTLFTMPYLLVANYHASQVVIIPVDLSVLPSNVVCPWKLCANPSTDRQSRYGQDKSIKIVNIRTRLRWPVFEGFVTRHVGKRRNDVGGQLADLHVHPYLVDLLLDRFFVLLTLT